MHLPENEFNHYPSTELCRKSMFRTSFVIKISKLCDFHHFFTKKPKNGPFQGFSTLKLTKSTNYQFYEHSLCSCCRFRSKFQVFCRHVDDENFRFFFQIFSPEFWPKSDFFINQSSVLYCFYLSGRPNIHQKTF